MESYPLRTVRQPAANVNVSRARMVSAIVKTRPAGPPTGSIAAGRNDTPSSRLGVRGPARRAGQSQANFTANTAAITKTPAGHSRPRPASTLLTT